MALPLLLGIIAAIGTLVGIATIPTFIEFIHEEALQTAGMSVYIAIQNHNWSAARKALESFKKTVEMLEGAVNRMGWLNPWSEGAFQAYVDAAKTQVATYEKIINEKLGVPYYPEPSKENLKEVYSKVESELKTIDPSTKSIIETGDKLKEVAAKNETTMTEAQKKELEEYFKQTAEETADEIKEIEETPTGVVEEETFLGIVWATGKREARKKAVETFGGREEDYIVDRYAPAPDAYAVFRGKIVVKPPEEEEFIPAPTPPPEITAPPAIWEFDPSRDYTLKDNTVWQYVEEYNAWYVYHHGQPEISNMTMTEEQWEAIQPKPPPAPPPPEEEIISCTVSGTPYVGGAGDELWLGIELTNTGTVTHTFMVKVECLDPDSISADLKYIIDTSIGEKTQLDSFCEKTLTPGGTTRVEGKLPNLRAVFKHPGKRGNYTFIITVYKEREGLLLKDKLATWTGYLTV